jgi:selenide,water dikinase
MDQIQENKIALTEYAHGAGCGCKIAPAVLQEILNTHTTLPFYDKLLVGNDSNDDAAVYQLNDEESLISTTDFFTPIVDDAFLFGQIAAANAVSDVYAMGGNPLLAVAILGFPVETLPVSVAQQMIEGARNVCATAEIPLAGGHSIDSREPIFGLAVNGLVKTKHLKRNNTATEGDYLLLTKPVGVGILSTAQKRKKLLPEHYEEWTQQMIKLNSIGAALGAIEAVTAMTDITGFGLLGHLLEMTKGSNLSMELYYDKVPILASARQYAAERIIPDATYRNWNGYNPFVQFEAGVNVMEAFNILPDPQTNGGLLVAVKEEGLEQVRQRLIENGYDSFTEPIGRMIARNEKVIYVK